MDLDLLPYAQALRRRAVSDLGGAALWCRIRRAWVLVQPEELVRQALIAALVELGYRPALMQVERRVGSGKGRLDLLCLDRAGRAYLLVECKAPGVQLHSALVQLSDYNRSWQAPYLLAVNGTQALAYRCDFEGGEVVRVPTLPPAPPADV